MQVQRGVSFLSGIPLASLLAAFCGLLGHRYSILPASGITKLQDFTCAQNWTVTPLGKENQTASPAHTESVLQYFKAVPKAVHLLPHRNVTGSGGERLSCCPHSWGGCGAHGGLKRGTTASFLYGKSYEQGSGEGGGCFALMFNCFQLFEYGFYCNCVCFRFLNGWLPCVPFSVGERWDGNTVNNNNQPAAFSTLGVNEFQTPIVHWGGKRHPLPVPGHLLLRLPSPSFCPSTDLGFLPPSHCSEPPPLLSLRFRLALPSLGTSG